MAGGIDWFRWHHGSATDPKFRLIARRAGSRVGDVLAVWALLLERASASDDRGHPGALDMETIEEAFSLTEGEAQRIYDSIVARGLIDPETGRIVRWEARQPKRERVDENSTERSRQHREKKRHATPDSTTATPRNATQRQETPREEESREEKSNTSPSLRSGEGAHKRATPPVCPEEVDEKVWADWLQLRKAKKAPVTDTVILQARSEAKKAGMTLEAFLREWCVRGSQGLKADWLTPNNRAGPGGRSPTAAEHRVLQAVPSLAAPHLRLHPQQTLIIESESSYVPAIGLD
jgi:hypothetical protein